MRALSYRVWDNEKKEYSDSTFSLDQYGLLYIQDEDGYWEEADEDRFIIEFDTGLYDRDGNKIYDGDIIQEEIDTGDDLVDGIHEYAVVWDKECLCWGLKGLGFKNDLYEVNRTVEVVRNIHNVRSH